MPSVDDSIQFVKGIGPKKAKLLEKLHIRTLRDALETYPRDYEDRTHITPIAEIDMEDKYAVRAVVGTEPKVNRIRKGLTLVKCTIYDETGTLNVTYFNNPYAAAQLRVGQEYVFYGKVQGFGRGRTMVSPQSEKVAPDADHPGRIVPVYPLTAGLTQRDLERVTAAALDTLTGEWPDPLPELLRAKYRLPDAVDALSAIHRPKTKDDVAQARRRMVFEELFLLCCGLQQLKERRKADSGIVFTSNGLDSFFEALPFTPTGAQRRAIMEIAADCASGRPMNRLVQGERLAGGIHGADRDTRRTARGDACPYAGQAGHLVHAAHRLDDCRAETCGTGRHRDRCGAGGRGHARAHSAGCAVPPAGCRYRG